MARKYASRLVCPRSYSKVRSPAPRIEWLQLCLLELAQDAQLLLEQGKKPSKADMLMKQEAVAKERLLIPATVKMKTDGRSDDDDHR